MEYILLFFATILQNASFTLVSRARNSPSILFHALASVASNGIWFVVINLITQKQNVSTLWLGVTYTIAAVIGSITMHWLSMNYLEKWFAGKKKADKYRIKFIPSSKVYLFQKRSKVFGLFNSWNTIGYHYSLSYVKRRYEELTGDKLSENIKSYQS